MTFAAGSRLATHTPAATMNEVAFIATVETEITRVFVTNTTGGALTYRIYHVPKDVALATVHALFYDVSVAANSVADIIAHAPGAGVHMEPEDALYVRASATGMNFNIYGVTANQAP